jgi:hypothetical protein
MSSGGETIGTPSSNLDKQGIADALRGVGAIASVSLLTFESVVVAPHWVEISGLRDGFLKAGDRFWTLEWLLWSHSLTWPKKN